MTYNFTQNGDCTFIPIEVANLGQDDCFMAAVAFNLPSEITVVGYTLPKGQFDLTTNTWQVGDLLGQEKVIGQLKVRIDDITILPVQVTATITSTCTETNASNNVTLYDFELFCPNLTAGKDGNKSNLKAKK